MRLRERELIEAVLVKRVEKTGSLGSRPEAFSQEGKPFRAALLDEGGDLQTTRHGLNPGEKIRLLTGDGIDARPGDGVHANDRFYIVLAVNRWTAHVELVCEARV